MKMYRSSHRYTDIPLCHFTTKNTLTDIFATLCIRQQKAMCGQVLVRENDMENHEL